MIKLGKLQPHEARRIANSVPEVGPGTIRNRLDP